MKINLPTLVASADLRSSRALLTNHAVHANRAAAVRAHALIAIDAAASRGDICGTGTWAYAPSAVKPFFTENTTFMAKDHSQRKRMT